MRALFNTIYLICHYDHWDKKWVDLRYPTFTNLLEWKWYMLIKHVRLHSLFSETPFSRTKKMTWSESDDISFDHFFHYSLFIRKSQGSEFNLWESWSILARFIDAVIFYWKKNCIISFLNIGISGPFYWCVKWYSQRFFSGMHSEAALFFNVS